MTKTEIEAIKNRIITGQGTISFIEAIFMSKTKEVDFLCQCANEIREHFSGNTMDLCSIINAKSGKCDADCKWCSQSSYHKTNIKNYDYIDRDEALAQAKNNFSKGVHKFSLVTSGIRLADNKLDKMLEIYDDIKKETDIELCASMGLLKKPQLEKLKARGIKNYHCNLETSPTFFDKLVTTHKFEDKVETIKWAAEAGLKICSGGIIGMGETMDQRVELAFELNKLQVSSIPVNILNPIEGTGLAGQQPLNDNEILVSFAMFRFINPQAQIRFAGGRLQIAHIEEKALKAGINAALVGDLLTTVGKNIEEDINNFKQMGYNVEKQLATA